MNVVHERKDEKTEVLNALDSLIALFQEGFARLSELARGLESAYLKTIFLDFCKRQMVCSKELQDIRVWYGGERTREPLSVTQIVRTESVSEKELVLACSNWLNDLVYAYKNALRRDSLVDVRMILLHHERLTQDNLARLKALSPSVS